MSLNPFRPLKRSPHNDILRVYGIFVALLGLGFYGMALTMKPGYHGVAGWTALLIPGAILLLVGIGTAFLLRIFVGILAVSFAAFGLWILAETILHVGFPISFFGFLAAFLAIVPLWSLIRSWREGAGQVETGQGAVRGWRKPSLVFLALVFAVVAPILLLPVVMPLAEYTTLYPRQDANPVYETPYLFGSVYDLSFDLPGCGDGQVDALRKKVTIGIDPPQSCAITETDGRLMNSGEHFFFHLKPNGIRKLRITFHFSDPAQWPAKLEVGLHPPSL